MKMINVAKDFSRFPAGRKADKGNTSGEAFRLQFIEPAIRDGEPISIELDGVIGYGSSFLEEAFGGAIRATGISVEKFFSLVHLVTSNSLLIKEIDRYIRDAAAQKVV